jgi:flagellin-like hook-associated protein FlgL
MSIRVNENANLIEILRQTRESVKSLSRSTERLASGVRFNSAGDDPGAIGGVVLSERAINGIQEELKSLNEGISFTQQITDNLFKIEDILTQIRTLSEEATSSESSDLDRETLQREATDLLKKIDDIIDQTIGSDTVLIKDGAVGVTNASSPKIPLYDLNTDSLGQVYQHDSQRRGVFVSSLGTDTLSINEVQIRPTHEADDTASTTYQSGSAIAKVAAINVATYETGVSATVGATSITGNRPIQSMSLSGLNYFIVNGSVFTGLDFELYDRTHTLREAINAETRYTGVVADVDSLGQLVLTADDGRNIQISYANDAVLQAIGVTDQAGDVPNLEGDLSLSSPDRNLNGEVQLPLTTDFSSYVGNVSVGGRFSPSEDYIDFVAQVVQAGNLGTAQIRLDRDPTSEVNPAEDFLFIEGTVDPNVDISAVLGDFFSTGGSAVASGDYNEAIDRNYRITATKAGTTDGLTRAEFQVSTVEDGVVGTFVANSNTGINIAGPRTGEDVLILFSDSPRISALSSNLASGHEYDETVTIGGTYNGDINSTTTVDVLTSGRTQGTPQATVQVYHDGVAFGGPATVTGGAPIDIGNGQTLTFASDLPNYSAVTATTTGTYVQPITVNSDPSLFTAIGAATYEVEVTQAGSVSEARYIVNKDGAQVSAGDALLTVGTILVADGITFNVPDAPTDIGATTVTTSHSENIVDHYQDYGTVAFVGTYDGALSNTTLEVRVKQEGIVLGSAESEVGRSDYAILEYRFGGSGSFTGDLVAREGSILIDNGVSFQLPNPSADPTIFDGITSADYGTVASLPAFQVGGYDGTIQFTVDPNTYESSEDVRVVFSSAAPVDVPNSGVNSDTLTVKLISENQGTLLSSTNIQPVSGQTYTLDTGLTLSFTNNPGVSATLTPSGGNDDTGVIAIEAGGVYNASNGNDEILLSFSNVSDVSITKQIVNGNDGVDATVGANVYNGTYGDKTITLQLGTSPTTETTLFSTGANGVNDNAPLSITGTYSGANASDDIRVEYLNRLSVKVAPDLSNDDGRFDITPTISGSNDINRAYSDLILDITLSSFDQTVATSSPEDVTLVGVANGSFYGDFDVKRVNSSKLRVQATPEGGSNSKVDVKYSEYVDLNGILDLGDVIFQPIFGNTDPGFDLDLSSASIGQQYDFTTETVRDYTFRDPNTGTQIVVESNAGTFDLGSTDFTTAFFTQGDPGFDLQVTDESDGVDDQFRLSWSINPTVAIYEQAGGTQKDRVEVALTLNGDQSQGTFDLDNALVDPIFDEGKPNITLVVDQPLNAIDDTYSILGEDPVVSFSDGVTTVQGGALLSSYTLSDALFAPIFNEGTPGDVVINLSSIAQAEDDSFLIDLESTTDVYASETDLSNSQQLTVQGDGTIDLAQVGVTQLLTNNTDPGFDLKVTDLDRGIDDQYTLSLSAFPSIAAQSDVDIVLVNEHSLQLNDTFSTNLAKESFAVGDTFSVDVDSEHLQQGSLYSISNTLGEFNIGDQLEVSTTHEFQTPTYTLEASTTILNGLTLDFDQAGPFELGDEVRFQVRGYTGDPVASGTYTNAISPTTFTIEVTTTGDIDGGAIIKYTRADTGETVDGFAASTTPVELADGVKISFSAGRLYAGDQFFIDTFESLDQIFGGEVILSSDDDIKIDYADVNGDNYLGRVAYQGSETEVDDPGTTNNPTSEVLRKNPETAINQLNLRTQTQASESIILAQNALNSLESYRQELSGVQSLIEQLFVHYEDRKDIKQEILAEQSRTEPSIEGPKFIDAIRSSDSSSLLGALEQTASPSLLSLVQNSLIDPDRFTQAPPKEEFDFESLKPEPLIESNKKEEESQLGAKKKDKDKTLFEKLKEEATIDQSAPMIHSFGEFLAALESIPPSDE